jgi:nucleotide-binding universal stress UspA family protein
MSADLAGAPVPHTVLVPLDGSDFAERALPVAREVVRRVHGRLLLMTSHWDSSEEQRRTAYLEKLAGAAPDVPTEIVSVDEHPNAHAIEYVHSESANQIVCMASHSRGRIGWAVLGSVAEAVTHDSRRPMLVVGRNCREDWPEVMQDLRYVLVCVDGSTVHDPVVPIALSWAKALALDVQVARVIHPLDLGGIDAPDYAVNAIAHRFAAAGVDARAVVLDGAHAAGVIADYASELPAALVVMNTHARGGWARMTLGSVAIATVGLAECPVLLVPMRDYRN